MIRLSSIVAMLSLASLCAGSLPAVAEGLIVGDPAPRLTVKEFVKGKPVTAFAPGTTYVVEFWATWCGPCKTSIPHLTELQKKYKDVQFIGVSVWEQDQNKVKPFVAEMGEKMGYAVAMDSIEPGKSGNDGAMATNWMKAAGQNGIPAAFIVNGEGRIAWVGHPMGMDEPLSKVVAGTWDVNAAKATMAKESAQKQKMMKLQTEFSAAMRSKQTGKAIGILDHAISEDPSMEAQLGVTLFTLLIKPDGDQKRAISYGNKLLNGEAKDNPMLLNAIAWPLVDPDAPTANKELKALGLQAAERADTLSKGKDAAIADTYGAALYLNGKFAKAVSVQTRAIALAKGTQLEQDKSLTEHLDKYRKAVKN